LTETAESQPPAEPAEPTAPAVGRKPDATSPGWRPRLLVWLRRLTQLALLGLFLWFFVKNQFIPPHQVQLPTNLFFRADPLLGVVDLFSGVSQLHLLWPALILAGATLVLGRFFCGWICPLGTCLDGFSRVCVPGRVRRRPGPDWRRVKYLVLAVAVATIPLGFSLVGLVDPLSLLWRTLDLTAWPALAQVNTWLGSLYDTQLAFISEPVYKFIRDDVLMRGKPVFWLPWLTLGIIAVVFVLEFVSRRFWCRNLCPLGALWGLLARPARLRRTPSKSCADCGDCAAICKTGAAGHSSECLLCLDCRAGCTHDRVRFKWRKKAKAQPLPDLGRRQVTVGLAAGLIAPPLLNLGVLGRPDRRLIRPPGVKNEREFTRRCVRCGLCFRVCPTGGLLPTLFEAGATGLYTPRLVPRTGNCNYKCTLCSQVCPTGAIPRLPLAVKQKTPMGVARVLTDLCHPYARGIPCLVCQEHCPTQPKAIVIDQVTEWGFPLPDHPDNLGRPRVEVDRCIGCGICEKACPYPAKPPIKPGQRLAGEAAIQVFNLAAAPPPQKPPRPRDRVDVWFVRPKPRAAKKPPSPYGR
jgi:ferredoxin